MKTSRSKKHNFTVCKADSFNQRSDIPICVEIPPIHKEFRPVKPPPRPPHPHPSPPHPHPRPAPPHPHPRPPSPTPPHPPPTPPPPRPSPSPTPSPSPDPPAPRQGRGRVSPEVGSVMGLASGMLFSTTAYNLGKNAFAAPPRPRVGEIEMANNPIRSTEDIARTSGYSRPNASNELRQRGRGGDIWESPEVEMENFGETTTEASEAAEAVVEVGEAAALVSEEAAIGETAAALAPETLGMSLVAGAVIGSAVALGYTFSPHKKHHSHPTQNITPEQQEWNADQETPMRQQRRNLQPDESDNAFAQVQEYNKEQYRAKVRESEAAKSDD